MENSGIQWTNHTFNPWLGCQRVSPGCEHCYAEALVTKRFKLPVWGPAKTTPRHRTGAANWHKPLKWNRAAAEAGRKDFVFCASLADVFEDHPAVAPWRSDLFALIEQTPHLTWQLLTKRPENLQAKLPQSWLDSPRENVWLGCTLEDRARARKRLPWLLDTPAAVRFVSVEPLLEALDLTRVEFFFDGPDEPPVTLDALRGHSNLSGLDLEGRIGWVIVGGESGPGARPFDLEWARSIVSQCREAHVPVFVKQLGARPQMTPGPVSWPTTTSHGDDLAEVPEDLRVREFPEVRS